MKNRGFTLIETVIYLALFGMLMGGAVVAAFNLFESAERQITRAALQNEGSFLMGKIQWAVSGAQAVNLPAGGTSGSQLSVNKVTGLDVDGLPIITAVTIHLPSAPGDVFIQNGAIGPLKLNGQDIQVSSLTFLHTIASGNGVDPESVQANATLTARTPNGMLLSQDFSTTVYVRR